MLTWNAGSRGSKEVEYLESLHRRFSVLPVNSVPAIYADGKEDLSEWQEAKPKRSQQRQREQQKQEPTTPQKGRQGSSTTAVADAPQKADPILASLARQKPDVHLIGGCLKCYDRSHR